jgi:hypothetical protein
MRAMAIRGCLWCCCLCSGKSCRLVSRALTGCVEVLVVLDSLLREDSIEASVQMRRLWTRMMKGWMLDDDGEHHWCCSNMILGLIVCERRCSAIAMDIEWASNAIGTCSTKSYWPSLDC